MDELFCLWFTEFGIHSLASFPGVLSSLCRAKFYNYESLDQAVDHDSHITEIRFLANNTGIDDETKKIKILIYNVIIKNDGTTLVVQLKNPIHIKSW